MAREAELIQLVQGGPPGRMTGAIQPEAPPPSDRPLALNAGLDRMPGLSLRMAVDQGGAASLCS